MDHGLVQAALDALTRANVTYSIRKGPSRDEYLPDGGEIDLWIPAPDVDRAAGALAPAGFHYLKAGGHPDHLFWLGFAAGAWLKVDVKVEATEGISGLSSRLAPLARRRPLGLRRVGPVIALLGPDGAGKGSVVSELKAKIPVAVSVVYMGAPRSRRPAKPDSAKRRPSLAREFAFIVRRLIRAWALLGRSYASAWRGSIVICDRHPIEVLAIRPQRSPWGTRLEQMLFAHLLPRPDQIVVLDAPAEVLLARKGEHSIEVLERWRRNYAEEFMRHGAIVVPSDGPLSKTVAAVSEIVWDQLCIRRQW